MLIILEYLGCLTYIVCISRSAILFINVVEECPSWASPHHLCLFFINCRTINCNWSLIIPRWWFKSACCLSGKTLLLFHHPARVNVCWWLI